MSVEYWFLLLVIYIMVNKDTENFFKKKSFLIHFKLLKIGQILLYEVELLKTRLVTCIQEHHMTIHVYSAFRQ